MWILRGTWFNLKIDVVLGAMDASIDRFIQFKGRSKHSNRA